MANYKTGAQRYNDRMDKIFANAHRLEKERLSRGEMPNPSLTSPEEGRKYGWEIKGREVSKIKKNIAKKMGPGSPSKHGSVSYSGHHAHDKHELPSNRILRPAKHKPDSSDLY